MFLGLLVLLTALTISAVAIFYSVSGLVAIFAAAALPIMIMGGVLEVGKLVTAVWLHRYWSQTKWWLKSYLSIAVVVLMFITSMGIFGFLSKAHIEQTSASEESVAQVQRIETEIGRLTAIIDRAEQRIENLQENGVGADANIQSQIDKEQERIDLAFERIQPAIAQQNQIIIDARDVDATRTRPYEQQLSNIQAEILRLETSAKEYEETIRNLDVDSSGVEPLLAQINALEEEIIRVTNQLNSDEIQQIRAGQAIIGVTSDGLFGNNTRIALANWVSGQRDRITQIQGEVAEVRKNAQLTVNEERDRLAAVVQDIRQRQIPSLKDRELTMLGKIDEVRQTESPVIATARDEIQRLRESAEGQVANSQALIQRLRAQLAQEDKAEEIEAAIDEQTVRIKESNTEIDELTERKYELEAEYRKLEAEVGPIKYIAEFVYGEQADQNLLEEAVRWVILLIIFVFDPLAVLLLIASQYTFENLRKNKEEEVFDWDDYEQKRAQAIVNNPGPEGEKDVNVDEAPDTVNDESAQPSAAEQEQATDKQPEQAGTQEETSNDSGGTEGVIGGQPGTPPLGDDTVYEIAKSTDSITLDEKDVEEQMKAEELVPQEIQPAINMKIDEEWQEREKPETKKKVESSERLKALEEKENDAEHVAARTHWKAENPSQTLKHYKNLYEKGVIESLPWEEQEFIDKYVESKNNQENEYTQNGEQDDDTLFNKLKK